MGGVAERLRLRMAAAAEDVPVPWRHFKPVPVIVVKRDTAEYPIGAIGPDGYAHCGRVRFRAIVISHGIEDDNTEDAERPLCWPRGKTGASLEMLGAVETARWTAPAIRQPVDQMTRVSR